MDLIGGYGSDVSEDDQHGPANGVADAVVNGGYVVRTELALAASPPAVSEQLARLPAATAADNDRWGAVFGTGIRDRKHKPTATSNGLSNGAAGRAVAMNGHSADEGVLKRKLVSFMAPLKPLTAEELDEDRPKKKAKSETGAGGTAASFLSALPPPKHHGGGGGGDGGGGALPLGGGMLGSGSAMGGTGLDLGDTAGPPSSYSMPSPAAAASGGSSAAKPAPAVAYTNDLYRVADGDDGGGVDYGPAANPPADYDYEVVEAAAPVAVGSSGNLGVPSYQATTTGSYAAHYVEHAAAAGPSGYAGPLTAAQPKLQRDGDVMLAASLAAEQAAAAKRAGDDPFADLGVSFVEVNQKELTYVPPAQKEAQAGVRAALGPAYEQKLRAEADKVLPSKISKRKHQINSLYHAAKMKELELLEKRGQSLKTKAETQAKYGW